MEPEVFPDGECADEQIFLLDVGRHARHAAADSAAVDSDFAADEQFATVTIRQHVQQRRLPGTTAHRQNRHHQEQPRACSGVVKRDTLRFLAGCRTRRKNRLISPVS